MYCKHCSEEQETVTIAGVTYCASCSTILSEKKDSVQVEAPKHKMPKLETTDNEIRNEVIENPPRKKDLSVQEMEENLDIPAIKKDELGGSAILLDILETKAKEETDEHTLEEDKKLSEASGEVLDILNSKPNSENHKEKRSFTPKPNGMAMNDIRPASHTKNKEHLQKKNKEILKSAENEIKDEAEQFARIVSSQSGYTREYDMMIMTIAIAVLATVVLVIYLTFK